MTTDVNGRGREPTAATHVHGGPIAVEGPGQPGEPILRWHSRAHSIEEIEHELARIWAQPNLTALVDGTAGRHVAARTSVMNLVVVARRLETAQGCAATIQMLTGRHPSRTIILSPADPDGPSWMDAQIQAHCVLPRADAPEVCAETIFLTVGGEAGRHAAAVVAPLLVHDLPVTLWWPVDPPFGSRAARELLGLADRLVVDGSRWPENGLARLSHLAGLVGTADHVTIFDFALVRQARWREAIAAVFDHADFLPYLGAVRRIAVTYASRDETDDPRGTNIVKPTYHVAWLASRLGLTVERPLEPLPPPRRTRHGGSTSATGRGFSAQLRGARSQVTAVVRPVQSTVRGGTTLRVELQAERRGSELRADVTAEAEVVRVRVWRDGIEELDRHFQSRRRTDGDLLAEAIEATSRDPVAHATIRLAGDLAGGAVDPAPHRGSSLA